MKEIYPCRSEFEFIQIMEEIDDPVGVPLTLTVIDYDNSLYQKLDRLNIVARLGQISQLGVADRCYNLCFLPTNSSRYSHSLIFATKIDQIAQTYNLDRNLAVITAMLHDTRTTPKSDSVANAMGINDEEHFEKTLDRCPELNGLLKEYSVSKQDIIRMVRGEDDSPIGQLVNGNDSIDVDRFSYTIYDAYRLGLIKVRSNAEIVDPFKSMSIVDGKVVFTDIDSVTDFLEKRTKMFEYVYKGSNLMAKEAFIYQLTNNLKDKKLIDEESIFDMTDYDFELLARRHGGELGKRIFDIGGFKTYGSTGASEEEVEKFLRERTSRPFVLKKQKPVNPAIGTPVMIKGKIKPFKEWKPQYSDELKTRMSAWNQTNIYGYDEDPEFEEAASKALERFGCI